MTWYRMLVVDSYWLFGLSILTASFIAAHFEVYLPSNPVFPKWSGPFVFSDSRL